MDIATLDFDRYKRRGYPEAVLCQGKSVEQVRQIAMAWRERAEASDEPLGTVLFTRASNEQLAVVEEVFGSPSTNHAAPSSQAVGSGTDDAVQGTLGRPSTNRDPRSSDAVGSGTDTHAGGTDPHAGGTDTHAEGRLGRPLTVPEPASASLRARQVEGPSSLFIDRTARLAAWPATPPAPSGGRVTVVCAGTSDLPVAREAALTARYLGREVTEIVDVGVAGLNRILARVDDLQQADVIVLAAGMDAALVPVVAGLVSCPMVAVPTSTGYGASFDGVAALLSMLNSCSPGVGVVNIDNGYGAGHLAAQIAAPRRHDA